MAEKTTVVTPERFGSGFTYDDYIEQIKVNKDRFEQYYNSAQLSDEDVAFFRRAKDAGATKMLILGEDWCPDVFRGMPVLAKIAEAAGMDVSVFPRDENLDIMNEFLKNGEFMSIPVPVFYTDDLEEIAHWHERPESANEEMPKITEDVKAEIGDEDEQEFRRTVRDRMQARYPAWQVETVRELRELLAEKLSL